MSIERWRERVNQELAGASLDSLVTRTNGLQVQPLYTSATRNPLAARVGAVELGVLLGSSSVPDAADTWRVGGGEGRVVEVGSALHERGALVIHALPEAGQGVRAVTEVALTIGRMLDALRRGTFAGTLAITCSEEFYVSVAKVRALRLLACRAAATWSDAPIRILARTSLTSFSRIDPETNAIRATIGSCAAIVGGANFVATAPFDVLTGAQDTGARLAFTTGLVATLESFLASSEDAAAGSYAIETMTHELAREAWELVRGWESRGGLAANEADARVLCNADAERQAAAVTMQRIARVGSTKLALLDAKVEGALLPEFAYVTRDSAGMEAWREVTPRTPVLMLIVGDTRKLNARAEYVRELFATLGSPSQTAHAASIEGSLLITDSLVQPIVVLVTEDAMFASLAPLAKALSKSKTVVVAGKPGVHESALRAAGVRSFVFVGMNVLARARELFEVGL